MADKKVEFVIGLVYTITAAASIGAGEFSVFGIEMLDALHTGMGFTLDFATVGSIIALGHVWWANRPDLSRMGRAYQVVVLATVALVAWGSWDPAFAGGEDIIVQFVLVSVSLAGYWAMAHN